MATQNVQAIHVTSTGEISTLTWANDNTMLAKMQDAVGGMIAVVDLPSATMIVNDEGLMRCEPNPVATLTCIQIAATSTPYFGDVVFLGAPDSEGNETSVPEWLSLLITTTAAALSKAPEVTTLMNNQSRIYAHENVVY